MDDNYKFSDEDGSLAVLYHSIFHAICFLDQMHFSLLLRWSFFRVILIDRTPLVSATRSCTLEPMAGTRIKESSLPRPWPRLRPWLLTPPCRELLWAQPPFGF